jgi:hypothetical protein
VPFLAFLILDQNTTLILAPFWMSEINFRLHFSPFQIKTQLSDILSETIQQCQNTAYLVRCKEYGQHFGTAE